MEEKLLELIKINKSYYNKKILSDINLTIYQGERIAILGANGTGKTTLCEIISQIQIANSGTINYFFSNNKNIKNNLGIQLQESHWPAFLTIKDIIRFYKNLYSNFNFNLLNELMIDFKLNNLTNSHLRKLSPGQRQSFNLLLALVHEPEILILDELTTGLDLAVQKNVINYLQAILKNKKQTLLLISHNLNEIEKLCNRIIVLKDKQIIFDQAKTKIIKQYGTLDNFIAQVI